METAADDIQVPIEDMSILVIDDNDYILELLVNIIADMGFKCTYTANNGREGLELFDKHKPAVAIIDVILPGNLSGLDLLTYINSSEELTKVIIVTGDMSNDVTIEALRRGACDFICKPIVTALLKHSIIKCVQSYNIQQQSQHYNKYLEKEVQKHTQHLSQVNKELYDMFSGAIEALVRTMESRDYYTAQHQFQVAKIAEKIAKKMGLTGDEVETIRIGSLVHDIGKMYVPQDLLVTPRNLEDIELELIKYHSTKGFKILKPIPFDTKIAIMALQHHERIDGSGYPSGLIGDDIILPARIVAVADVVDAICSHRPYRPAKSTQEALYELETYKGERYCMDAANACLEVIKEYNNSISKIYGDTYAQ